VDPIGVVPASPMNVAVAVKVAPKLPTTAKNYHQRTAVVPIPVAKPMTRVVAVTTVNPATTTSFNV
tara:strand:+ start:307 stop:504 length:198 start_codon:yes stop_codon:yes gene_type:complete